MQFCKSSTVSLASKHSSFWRLKVSFSANSLSGTKKIRDPILHNWCYSPTRTWTLGPPLLVSLQVKSCKSKSHCNKNIWITKRLEPGDGTLTAIRSTKEQQQGSKISLGVCGNRIEGLSYISLHNLKWKWWKSNDEIVKWEMEAAISLAAREEVAAFIKKSTMDQMLNQCHSGTNFANMSKGFW